MNNRMFSRCLLTLLCMATVLVWIGRYTNIDLQLADAMFDFSTKDFPWREHWFTFGFMHGFAKALLIGIGLVPIAALVADVATGRTLFEEQTRRSLYVVAASCILIPVAISTLKSISIYHCPWSLTRYGGFSPYLRIFDRLPPGVSAGHCFPAGHASSGLWLAAIGAFWLPRRPGKALFMFCIGLIPGVALGWTQQMRGAHFLTHTLWSVWIAALIVLVLARLLCQRPAVRVTVPGNLLYGVTGPAQ